MALSSLTNQRINIEATAVAILTKADTTYGLRSSDNKCSKRSFKNSVILTPISQKGAFLPVWALKL